MGGQQPILNTYIHQASGFLTEEEEFVDEVRPAHARKPVGAERFPLWYETEREAQATDMVRQILEEKPYPIRAVVALGMKPEVKQVLDSVA